MVNWVVECSTCSHILFAAVQNPVIMLAWGAALVEVIEQAPIAGCVTQCLYCIWLIIVLSRGSVDWTVLPGV